jgi:uncharacterized protein YndB with AHSA1/START domain
MAKRTQYTIEYTFKAKSEMLFNYISTPYNLSIWFADEVQVKGDIFLFVWNKSSETAKMIKQIFKKKVVFQWIEREDNEYLTFLLDTDEITGDTVITITDFDFENQVESAALMWNSAIDKLKRLVGG